jgi:amidase
VSKKSAPFVHRLERTGLVCLGKSATPELGLTATTEPLGFPPTRNPWDPTRTAGGSSGGAAALVAAGVVPIAHASDGGGSIRVPAACCGLVGFKPSRGVIDHEGSNLLAINLATHGAITRTVRDTIAFYDALAPAAPAAAHRLRIGVFVDTPSGVPIHAEVRAAALAAGKLCESLGHHVEEIRCPFTSEYPDDFIHYWGFVAWLQIKSARVMMHRHFDVTQLEPWTHAIAAMFSTRKRDTLAAIRRLRRFDRTYAQAFASFDVLVCPTTGEPAPLLGRLAPDLPFDVKHDRLRRFVPFTALQNIAGAPAISLPLARTATGLPIGVMFAGPRGADRLLLELARQLEAAQPWPGTAPRERWARG